MSTARKRPRFIEVRFEDPFDGKWLGTNTICYDPRKAADGWYTSFIKGMRGGIRPIFRDTLEGRIPKSITRIIY